MEQAFDDDPLDPDTMAQLRELGDDGFISELAEMFLTDFDPAFAELLNAIATDDHVAAAQKAHFLKGASLSIGLLALAAVLKQIEDHFRDNGAEFSGETLTDLRGRADQARSRLRLLVA